jgi:hypothetical protein
MEHKCSCHDNEPLTRDEALDLAYELLRDAQAEALQGRVSEAQMLNGMAQTAIALAERTVFGKLSGPVH